ncbi:thioesterase family protein [Deinococcus sonorensis]|uniref:Thioesterase family protein n=2 Tax=Deinococcus sonorensis TaxID=309891 RepID=A0AAU7UCD1_9DEIO
MSNEPLLKPAPVPVQRPALSVPVQPVPSDVLNEYQISLTVREAELDELGHVNNVVYLRWIEDVARAHAEAVGAGFEEMVRLGTVAVVRKHTIHYHRPARLDEDINIHTCISGATGLRAIRTNRITHADTGDLVVDGQTEWVWVDPDSGRPKRPTAELLSKFGF